jgi:biotin carboxyl carrier protein
MIKKLRVTVDGKPYEVSVELPDEAGPSAAPPLPPPPISAPSAPPPPAATSQPAPAAKAPSGPGAVVSPLAGRIIAILVAPGQAVKEGDHVVTVEAMKMNTTVSASKTGKVAEILTTVGSAVDEGQVLLRIE